MKLISRLVSVFGRLYTDERGVSTLQYVGLAAASVVLVAGLVTFIGQSSVIPQATTQQRSELSGCLQGQGGCRGEPTPGVYQPGSASPSSASSTYPGGQSSGFLQQLWGGISDAGNSLLQAGDQMLSTAANVAGQGLTGLADFISNQPSWVQGALVGLAVTVGIALIAALVVLAAPALLPLALGAIVVGGLAATVAGINYGIANPGGSFQISNCLISSLEWGAIGAVAGAASIAAGAGLLMLGSTDATATFAGASAEVADAAVGGLGWSAPMAIIQAGQATGWNPESGLIWASVGQSMAMSFCFAAVGYGAFGYLNARSPVSFQDSSTWRAVQPASSNKWIVGVGKALSLDPSNAVKLGSAAVGDDLQVAYEVGSGIDKSIVSGQPLGETIAEGLAGED